MTFKALLLSAKAGNEIALQQLYEMYMPLIRHYSFNNGRFDDDLHQEQLWRFFHCVKKFSLDVALNGDKDGDHVRN